jgi:hypothetical protein
MGEAKRKKLAGWIPLQVRLKCFIGPSAVSDAHAVHLGIRRGEEIQIRRFSSFANISDAWEELCRVKQALLKLKYFDRQSNNEITQNLIRLNHELFGVFSCDDAQYTVSGDKKSCLKWLAEGKSPHCDTPPPGVCIEILNPPVQKRYKTLLFKMPEEALEEALIRTSCGDPEDTHVFTFGMSHDKPFLVEGKDVGLCSSYVSAAYVADHLNATNQSYLSSKEFTRLVYEANRLQGKI